MEDEQRELSSPSETKPLSFSEWADELCAQYMSIGVPYDEYWHGNYAQLPYYMKSYEISLERDSERSNHDAWLQGAYTYDALCAVSPVLHAFANKAKPTPYHEKPYKLSSEKQGSGENKSAKTAEEIEEIQAINASARMASFMTRWNKQFEQKGGDANGSGD